MISGTKGIILDAMQLNRIFKHPLQINENFIINDNLESGTIRIYEPTGGSLNIQQLYTGYGNVKGAVLVAESIINDIFNGEEEKGIFVHKIICEYGYEFLIQPIIEQILYFAGFYESHSLVRILDRDYEKLYPYAPKVFAGFQKMNRVYEYQLPDSLYDVL